MSMTEQVIMIHRQEKGTNWRHRQLRSDSLIHINIFENDEMLKHTLKKSVLRQ